MRNAQKRLDLLAVGQNALPAAVKVFLSEKKIAKPADLRKDTAEMFIEWRKHKVFSKYKRGKISASTIRHELYSLRRLAKAAGRDGLAQRWDARPLLNADDVRPLTVKEQKRILDSLKSKPACHDAVLMLLVSGVKAGAIKNARYRLNGMVSCPTLDKIYERGHVFRLSENALRCVLKRRIPGVSLNRLRSTFAANRLLAGVSAQTVGRLLEHARPHTLRDMYGAFMLRKILGSESEAKERRDWIAFLETGYFMPEAKPKSACMLSAVRTAENDAISGVMKRFGKIIAYKGKTLPASIRPDYESEAMNRLYRSVRLHLADWQSGKNDKLLSAIAAGAMNWALARKHNRDKIIENEKNKLKCV